MAKITWDEEGNRFYETGVKHGILSVWDDTQNAYGTPVAWNGLTGVTQSPSGAEATALYADDIKYLELTSNEDFGCTIEAYQSPVEFDECDGSIAAVPGVKLSGQKRKAFCFSYVTTIGNDKMGNDYGYKIHLVFGARAGVSERAYATINDSPEAMTLSWEVTTTPVSLDDYNAQNNTNFKPVAHMEIDTRTVDPDKLADFEDLLYGTAQEAPHFPTPQEVLAAFATA